MRNLKSSHEAERTQGNHPSPNPGGPSVGRRTIAQLHCTAYSTTYPHEFLPLTPTPRPPPLPKAGDAAKGPYPTPTPQKEENKKKQQAGKGAAKGLDVLVQHLVLVLFHVPTFKIWPADFPEEKPKSEA